MECQVCGTTTHLLTFELAGFEYRSIDSERFSDIYRLCKDVSRATKKVTGKARVFKNIFRKFQLLIFINHDDINLKKPNFYRKNSFLKIGNNTSKSNEHIKKVLSTLAKSYCNFSVQKTGLSKFLYIKLFIFLNISLKYT